MSFRGTYRPKIGPFRINTGRRGVTSVTTKVGPFTLRLPSKRRRGGISSIDLPGPVSWRASRRMR